jgi:PucR family transcriptional regulator, purine catabolism regulatory protein
MVMVIKANTMNLRDLFENNGEETNFLHSKRMFISSADAWGALIKDLVFALGIERAKQFLLRYGYQCGKHEANMLKDMFEWENQKEWVLGGVRMHNLAGRTRSVPIKVEIDTNNKQLDVEGYWCDSYEAKQYLQHFPTHSESVCYFLEGYASGYCSTSLGKKVVFKEVECIGKGDKHCHFVGKTLDLWGEDISDDLVDYGREDINYELDRAYKRIEKQRELLERGNSISNQLTKIVLQGKGLDSIAHTLGKSLECGIVISNQYFETITKYGETFNYSLKSVIDNVSILRLSDRKRVDDLINKRVTIYLNSLEEQDFTSLLITPIVVQNNVYGYITIIKSSDEIDELEPSFIERAANICALHILNEKKVIETEHRIKGEMLNEILFQPIQDSNISKRLHVLGYNLTKTHYVFIFRLQNKSINFTDDELLTNEKELIATILRKNSVYVDQEILISNHFGQIQALIPEDLLKARNVNASQYGEAIVEEIKRTIPTSQLLIGISNPCKDIDSLHNGYKQAKKALELVQMKGKKQRVILFSELGHLSILLDARSPEELENYAKKIIGPIYNYDVTKSTDLLRTMYLYINNGCNLHKTARSMNLSIGGMRYRLSVVKERFNIDIMDSSTRFEVQLAIDIYLTLDKIPLISI